MSEETKELLYQLIEIAAEAGRAILDVYNSEFEVSYKDDKSPLTKADERSHEIILHHLENLSIPTPYHATTSTPCAMPSAPCDSPNLPPPVLSEEGRDIPYDERKNWEYFYLVDPLDGTKEFVKRNGEFTVNIALIHKERPVLGVIYVPVKGTFYYAAEGLGAYKMDSSKIIDLTGLSSKEAEKSGGLLDKILSRSTRLPLNRSASLAFTQPQPQPQPFFSPMPSAPCAFPQPQPFFSPMPSAPCAMPIRQSSIIIVGSRSHASNNLENFIKEMEEKYGEVEVISAGSSLKFCLIAEGKADLYPRYGPTMEWDTAAGQVIVEQSGGQVLNMETKEPLRYNKEELLNPWFISSMVIYGKSFEERIS